MREMVLGFGFHLLIPIMRYKVKSVYYTNFTPTSVVITINIKPLQTINSYKGPPQVYNYF